jgi:hypothetical protein
MLSMSVSHIRFGLRERVPAGTFPLAGSSRSPARPVPASLGVIRAVLAAEHDARKVVGDDQAVYFGTRLIDASLSPGPNAHLGITTFADWLASRR